MSVNIPIGNQVHGTIDAALVRAAVDASSESLAVVEQGRIVYANQAFAAVFGYSHGPHLHGRSLSEFIPHSSPVPEQKLERGMRAAQLVSFPQGQFSSGLPDGTVRCFQASCAVFSFQGSDRLVVNVRDTGTANELGGKQKESQRMETLGRAVSSVAHDFNSLITGVVLYAELLISGLADHPRLRQHAEEIRRVSGHGADLIQQLLNTVRQHRDPSGVQSWNQVIEEMKDLLGRLAGENIELATELAGDLALVPLDRTQAQQVVLNLVLNARDAMPDGGHIAVQTRNASRSSKPSSAVELVIADNGRGMDAKTCAHLFQPFFTTKSHGTGLGLHTVHNIVSSRGGSIKVQSAPGKGTRMVVRLPAIDSADAVAAIYETQGSQI